MGSAEGSSLSERRIHFQSLGVHYRSIFECLAGGSGFLVTIAGLTQCLSQGTLQAPQLFQPPFLVQMSGYLALLIRSERLTPRGPDNPFRRK